MKRSQSEQHGSSSFPLKLKTMSDGRVKATSVSVPGKEWFGDSEEQVTRSARQEIHTEFTKTGLHQTPSWAAEFNATIPSIDNWNKE